MASLVIAEHDNAALKDATHKTVTAAAAVSSPVHVLVAGENCAAVADAPGRTDRSETCPVPLLRCPAFESRLYRIS